MLQECCLTALLLIGLGVGVDQVHGWWEHGNFYQIYPRSFMDSDNDGIGDLRGIADKLDYLKDIGITATWLSPIFQSPMKDFGYDISDYYQIHGEYGTMDDFNYLIQRAEQLGIKIILDFVPNHTSDESEWFIKSEQKDAQYKDFYVWHPGRVVDDVRQPPNNWVSVFRGSAWTYSETRGEYYLHQFLKEQPDLNYRNPAVVDEMKNVLRYWLNKGVAGFRVDAVPYLFEISPDSLGNYADEVPTGASCPNPIDECYTIHNLTQNQPETFDMSYQLRAFMDEFTAQHKTEEKILMLEAYTPLENVMKLFGDGANNGSQIPFNFQLISNMQNTSSATDFHRTIAEWLDRIPEGNVSNWVMGNHDNKRIASRFGIQRADSINFLLQTLPGVAVTYYGEELGLLDVYISWEDTIDPAGCNSNSTIYERYSRDPARTPMPWNDGVNAGFSTAAKTWLPVSPDWKTVNVAAQKAAADSHMKIFQRLTNLRKEFAFKSGGIEFAVSGDVLLYKRSAKYGDTFVVAINIGGAKQHVDLRELFPGLLSTDFLIEVASLQSSHKRGQEYQYDFEMDPYEALILRASNPGRSSAAKLTPMLSAIINRFI